MSLRIFVLSFCFLLTLRTAEAQSQDSNLLKRGQEEFSKQRYKVALATFRDYLRQRPQDQDAWVWFGAAYYHTGQAQAALNTLQKAKPSPELKSLARYYIALSHDALGHQVRARKLLGQQARSKDLLAEEALFELAAIEYEDLRGPASRRAAEDYEKRYPKGRYQKQISAILEQGENAPHMEVQGTKRAQYKEDFFREHPLSLVPLQHLWYYEVGYDYVRGTRSNPGYKNGVPSVQQGIAYEEYQLQAEAGLILGPFRGQGTTSYAGYIYSQNWLSDSERMQIFFDEPSDVSYFPFRPDLMERDHRLFVETSGSRGNLSFGAYGHWIYSRAGSNHFPAPERPEIRKSFEVAVRTLFVPWADWQYLPQHKLRFYLLFKKELNRELPDYSYKTYNLSSNNQDPFFSYTLQHHSAFPRWANLKLKAELYNHDFLYNDYWESYGSTGFAALAQITLGSRYRLSARMALEKQKFSSDVIRSQSCSDKGGEYSPFDFGDEGVLGVTCPRVDDIVKYGLGASYINDNQQAFSLVFNYWDRKNDKLVVYNESKAEILFVFTHAFPGLDGIDRFIEPFVGLADSRGVY